MRKQLAVLGAATAIAAATIFFTQFLNASIEASAQEAASADVPVQLGPRPMWLVDNMRDGELKTALQACEAGPFHRTNFSIGHRGASLEFPEHTVESYTAAARMGAGIVECDVTFTADRQLVCRHAQCDLHTTTDILATPLAAKCSQPFTPASGETNASAQCCTSDITLAEFRTLHGKMDGANPRATTVEEYMNGTAGWRTDLYAGQGTLMTHAESIALFQELGVGFTPELKAPSVPMPFEGDYTQEAYAQQMIDEYVAAGVDPSQVFPQSFNLADVKYWIDNTEFGNQAVFLDDRYDTLQGFDPAKPETWSPTMDELVADGVKIVAPPLWVLVTMEDGEIVPSAYAEAAKAAGLEIITWSFDRFSPVQFGDNWYYQSVVEAVETDGDVLNLLDVLAQDVGVIGVFADWPATVTFYANCMGL
jgi:glycerophosphoryl diester phosphodiesterase